MEDLFFALRRDLKIFTARIEPHKARSFIPSPKMLSPFGILVGHDHSQIVIIFRSNPEKRNAGNLVDEFHGPSSRELCPSFDLSQGP
jgi:hypothetical protein